MSLIRFVGADTERDVAQLGGKGAGLAFLASADVRIPPAFVVTADAYRKAVGEQLRREVAQRLAAIPADLGAAELEARSAEVRALLLDGSEGHPLTADVHAAYERLRELTGEDDLCVAVRSSSIAEDAADRSFAGEHDTYLWVRGAEQVDRRLRECWASLVTARAVAYRSSEPSAQDEEMAMAVVVQQMAPARSAGVLMTLNPANGDRSKVMIESVWGLGEPLVSGEATPDRFLVDKITGEIVRREIVEKPTEAVRDPATGHGIVVADVPAQRREQPSLSGDEVAELLRVARTLERLAGGPQDAEFAVVAGEAPENVLLLQCRPETVWSQKPQQATAPAQTALAAVLATLTQGAASTSG